MEAAARAKNARKKADALAKGDDDDDDDHSGPGRTQLTLHRLPVTPDGKDAERTDFPPITAAERMRFAMQVKLASAKGKSCTRDGRSSSSRSSGR